MLLSARILQNVTGVNDWEVADEVRFTEGDSLYVFLMLTDLNKDKDIQRIRPSGRRYVPATGATLQVTVQSIDSAKTLVRIAVQPFANDPSIWKFQIMSTDSLRGTYSIKLALTEGATVTHGVMKNGVSAEPMNGAFC
jgi:hypothetical protein